MSDLQVAIIGGGVMGVSLAYHLARAGWSDIALFEKNDLTHGSTWHAAGLCTHFAHNPTIQELRAHSVRLYRDILPAETGQTCGFHRCGAMRITRNPDRMDEFAHVAGLSAFTGYPLEIVTPQGISELHPLTQIDGLIGGIYEPDDGHVDPTLATQAMAVGAVARGVEIRRRCAVLDIIQKGDTWDIVTEQGTFCARNIVNAAGTWGYEVGQWMGVHVPSVPVLHQYLVTDTVADVAARDRELPIIRDPEESWYVRQEREGLILGPYETEAQIWSPDKVPPDFGADLLPPDLDRVEHIIEAAMSRIPALGTAGLKTVVNGPITFTPDANPLIGPAAGVPGAWLLTGSSMGVMEGGGAGWFLAHWMTKGAPPMDALAIDPRRFGRWVNRDYRIAKAVECFGLQFGVHYPHEERPAGRGIRKSPLHDAMLARGAVMGAAYGWERPNWFSDRVGDIADHSFRRSNWFGHVGQECAAACRRVALADLSAFSKYRVAGPDTEPFLVRLGANTPPKPGRLGLTHALTPTGGVQSEFTVTRILPHSAYLTSAAAAEERDEDLLRATAQGLDVEVETLTDKMAVIGLMGPKSHAVLRACTDDALDFPWLSHRSLSVAGRRLRALRVSYIGEFGWELHVPREDAVQVFEALDKAGQPFGIGYYGAYAMNAMRLEKGYPAWGAELTTERSAIEAGLSRFVQQPSGLKQDWALVLLEIESADIEPFFAHTVWQGERAVGIVTSAAFGHRTGKTLALAYLRDPSARQDLRVGILGDLRKAMILPEPPYDPRNERLTP